MGRRIDIVTPILNICTVCLTVSCIVFGVILVYLFFVSVVPFFTNGTSTTPNRVVTTQPTPYPQPTLSVQTIPVYSQQPVQPMFVQSASRPVYLDNFPAARFEEEMPRININVGGEGSRFEEEFTDVMRGNNNKRRTRQQKIPITISHQ